MILFVGGPQGGFKRSDIHEQLLALVNSAMPQGVVLGNFSDCDYPALNEVVDLCGKAGESGRLRIRSPSNQDGVYLEINTPKADLNEQLDAAIQLVTTAIDHRKQAVARRETDDRPGFYKKLDPNQLRKNYGPGRALVVLPFRDYNADEWYWVNKVLSEEHEVELFVTSSEWGMAVDSRGKPQAPVDIMMDQFWADEFDYVVFVSGDMSQFGEEESLEREQLQSIVKTSLKAELILIAASRQANDFYDLCDISDCLNTVKRGVQQIADCGGGKVTLVEKPNGLQTLFETVPKIRLQKALGVTWK